MFRASGRVFMTFFLTVIFRDSRRIYESMESMKKSFFFFLWKFPMKNYLYSAFFKK